MSERGDYAWVILANTDCTWVWRTIKFLPIGQPITMTREMWDGFRWQAMDWWTKRVVGRLKEVHWVPMKVKKYTGGKVDF